MQEINKTLYGRLLEGIGEGISAALTRKPVEGMNGDGLDIDVPEDSSSFSKHSRDWHDLKAFTDMNVRLSSADDYEALSETDIAVLSDLYGRRDTLDAETLRLSAEHGDVLGNFHACKCKWEYNEIVGDDTNVYVVTDEGEEVPVEEWDFRNNEHAAFVCLDHQDFHAEYDGQDDSFCISREWPSQVSECPWQTEDFDIEDYMHFRTKQAKSDWFDRHFYDGFEKTKVILHAAGQYGQATGMTDGLVPAAKAAWDTVCGKNRMGFDRHGYLLSAGQMRILLDSMEEVNAVLDLIGAERLDMTKDVWWTSSQGTSAKKAVSTLPGQVMTDKALCLTNKTKMGRVLPVFSA